MTKSSYKRLEQSLKTTPKSQRKKPNQNAKRKPKTQASERKKRGSYLSSKVKIQDDSTLKEYQKEILFEQSSPQNILSCHKDEEDFSQKLNGRDQNDFMKSCASKNNIKIFYADKFQEVQEEDLLIYFKTLNHLKTSGVILVNEYGKIIYSDKIGHQLFEGSLNKFGTLKIQNLLLRTMRAQNLEQLKKIKCYNENTIFNWIIYSKNNKRRYSNVPFDSNKNSPYDIYFRFLKCLTIRIRPIKIQIKKFNLFEGLWNHQNIHDFKDTECFMLEIKNSTEMPSLDKEDILNDTILQKYIKSNSKKLQKLSLSSQTNELQLNKSKNSNTQDSIKSSSSLQEQKKHNQNTSNSANKNKSIQNKNSKNEDKKNTNSKQSYGVCLITEIFFDEE